MIASFLYFNSTHMTGSQTESGVKDQDFYLSPEIIAERSKGGEARFRGYDLPVSDLSKVVLGEIQDGARRKALSVDGNEGVITSGEGPKLVLTEVGDVFNDSEDGSGYNDRLRQCCDLLTADLEDKVLQFLVDNSSDDSAIALVPKLKSGCVCFEVDLKALSVRSDVRGEFMPDQAVAVEGQNLFFGQFARCGNSVISHQFNTSGLIKDCPDLQVATTYALDPATQKLVFSVKLEDKPPRGYGQADGWQHPPVIFEKDRDRFG